MGALSNVRVIDLTMGWAGPLATMLLAAAGAEVIKVEACQHPDWFRVPRPPRGMEGLPHEQSPAFNGTNLNKVGITLNLRDARGKALFKQLIGVGDVVVENYSPRAMPELGLPYTVLQQVNPQIIMVSMPAFGASGPWKGYIGYGQTVEPMSGLTALTGYEGGSPLLLSNGGDPFVALNGAVAILTALHHRQVTGRGQHVEVSHIEAVTPFVGGALMDYLLNKRVRPRRGNRHRDYAPHGCYRCRGQDQWVAMTISSDQEWQRFCGVIGRPALAQDERFHDAASRLKHPVELDAVVEEWTAQRDRYEVMQLLQEKGIAAGPVLSNAEITDDPHLQERGFFQEVARAHVGTHLYPGVPISLSGTPVTISGPAPCLGEDNRWVLEELLGLAPNELASLAADKVIGDTPSDAGPAP
ncbi:MAG: CoA transferase [Chloroflexi bacterium]|nr:CoA transferase [Chloroflexota bacterium]